MVPVFKKKRNGNIYKNCTWAIQKVMRFDKIFALQTISSQ